MTSFNETLSASFSTYGHSISTNINCLFDGSADETITIIQKGEKTTPTLGHITNNCPIHSTDSYITHNVANVKLTFMNNINSASPNNIVYDYTYTDELGNYIAFLEPGEYKIRVDLPSRRQFFFNQLIKEGIKEYFLYPKSAAIKTKIDDTTILYGTSKVLVSGCLVDELNKPHAGQIIISQNNDLVTFINTLTGIYQFLIDYGTYDVRLRSKDRSIKIYNNFTFIPNKGFFTELAKIDINQFNSDDNYKNLQKNEQINSPIFYTDLSRKLLTSKGELI